MDGDGEIIVKSYIENEELFIDVIDNGLGMPQETAEQILRGEKN